MSVESARNGNFEWRDIRTTDPEATKAFYTALFGWTFAPANMPGGDGYEIISNNGVQIGGVYGLSAEEGPSHWISFLTIDDFDAAVARVPELGGKVIVAPSDEIPGVGRWAQVADPSGAQFSPFSPAYPAGQGVTARSGMPPVGEVSWNELSTDNVDAAKRFYSGVVGWSIDEQDMGGMPYYILKTGERMDGGMMAKMPDAPASMWTVYFHVADIDASLAKINELGGNAFPETIDVPGTGRVGWASDSTGAVFALHQPPAEA